MATNKTMSDVEMLAAEEEEVGRNRATIGLLIAFAILFSLMMPATGFAAEIKFGLLPRLPEKELLPMFTPLAKHLEKETGMKVILVIPKDFDTYTKQAIAGDFDIGFTNPNIYITAKRASPEVEPLALAS